MHLYIFIKLSCFVLSWIFLSYIRIAIILLYSFSAGCLTSTTVVKVDTCHKHYIHSLTFVTVPSSPWYSIWPFRIPQHLRTFSPLEKWGFGVCFTQRKQSYFQQETVILPYTVIYGWKTEAYGKTHQAKLQKQEKRRCLSWAPLQP